MSAEPSHTQRIAFLGGGNMAEALIRGLLEQKRYGPADICVSDISGDRLAFLRDTYGVNTAPANRDAAADADVVVLAVKPHQINAVVKECAAELTGRLVVSIAAGVSLEAMLATGVKARFVRVMPNTPALIGAGVSALCGAADVSPEDMTLVRDIFSAVGRAVDLPAESLMDAVTGLSGSGPAYVFLFIEALADGGVKAGLPRPLALELAAQTVAGAARLVAESGKHPGELKDMVTSPAGTTIAGVHTLEKHAFRGAVTSAVEAAAQRSRELATK